MKQLTSFKHAFNGLLSVFMSERNFRIHITAIIIVSIAGYFLAISIEEWLAIILTFMIVTVVEILNTAIEKLSDIVSPDYNEKIKYIKDISAGAVLLSAIGAVAVGLIIFLPKVVGLFLFLYNGFN